MYVKIAAIGGIVIVAVAGICHGLDGMLIGGAMAIIGGIAGYAIAAKTKG